MSASTSKRLPIPSQAGQAPEELKAKDSALGGSKRAPHSGQVISMSCVWIDGSTMCPLGQRCAPSREIVSRSTLSTSLIVPTVLRGPGIGGRWRSASAGGRCSIRSTSGRWAWVSRRRL